MSTQTSSKSPLRVVAPLAVAWSLAFAAIAVLAAAMQPVPIPPRVEEAPRAPAIASGVVTVGELSVVATLDPITIVARRPPRRVKPEPPKEPLCSDWRGLIQGGEAQRVRACE